VRRVKASPHLMVVKLGQTEGKMMFASTAEKRLRCTTRQLPDMQSQLRVPVPFRPSTTLDETTKVKKFGPLHVNLKRIWTYLYTSITCTMSDRVTGLLATLLRIGTIKKRPRGQSHGCYPAPLFNVRCGEPGSNVLVGCGPSLDSKSRSTCKCSLARHTCS
jgi:hypothetical protein